VKAEKEWQVKSGVILCKCTSQAVKQTLNQHFKFYIREVDSAEQTAANPAFSFYAVSINKGAIVCSEH
jgi:hypothetical protein